MKPDFEQILTFDNQTVVSKRVKRKNRPMLALAWHYHPEIEICFTKQSEGTRYVGNAISDYEAGDLVMFGPNLPHGFTTNEKTDQVVIQFKQDFLGNALYKFTDFKLVRKLFDNASMGLEFYGNTRNHAKQLIKELNRSENLDKLIVLLKLLSLLSESDEYRTICSKEYSSNLKTNQLDKMKYVLKFIEENFKRNIKISDAARQSNLTDSAFYKFIKRHSKKKFTQILNEYRINYASKKLIETEMTIAEICFESGYRNKAYFNRKFKEILNLSPSEFRQQYN